MVLHANGQDMLLWVLRSIEMYFSCNYLQRGDLTTRQISSGGGNKGVVDLWMFKKEVASHFLGSFVDDHVDNAEIRKAIRLAMQDHCSHRSLFGWAMDEQRPDLTWHAGWKESERQVLFLAEAGFEGLRIIGIFACSSLFYFFFGLAFYRFALFVVLVGVFSQALIFNNGHDAVLKQAMKNRKTPPEALSYGGIEELVKDELNRPSWSVLQTFPIVLKQTSFLKVFSSVTRIRWKWHHVCLL